MCRKGRSAKGGGQPGYLLQADVGVSGEEAGVLSQHQVSRVHIDLMAKDGGVIGQRGQAAGYIRLELLPVIGGGEETDYVDLLPGAQLHPRQSQQASLLRRPAEGGAVAAGVVVGKGHNIQPRQRAHGRQVDGGHVLTAAGRQAGMEVEIVVILHVKLLFRITKRHRAYRPKRATRRAEGFRGGENLAAGRIHSARGSKRGSPPGVAGWGDRQECR